LSDANKNLGFVKNYILKGKEDMDIREQELRVFEEPPNPTSLL